MMASRCYKAVDVKSTSFECPSPPPVGSGGSQCSGWDLLKLDDATKEWIEDVPNFPHDPDASWLNLEDMQDDTMEALKDLEGRHEDLYKDDHRANGASTGTALEDYIEMANLLKFWDSTTGRLDPAWREAAGLDPGDD